MLPEPSAVARAAAASRLLAGELLAVAVLLPAMAAALPALRAADTPWTLLAAGGHLLLPTLGYAALAATAAVLLGGLVAAGVRRLPLPLVACAAVVSLLPLLVPASLMGTAWIMALGRDGIATSAASEWGVRLVTAYTWPVPAFLAGARTLGVPAIILLLAWCRLRASLAIEHLYRVSRPARWCWLRALPLAGPLAAGWLLAFLLVVVDPIFPGMLLTHTYATQMLVESNALLNPAGAAQLGLPLAIVGIAAGLLAWRGARSLPRSEPTPRNPALRAAPVSLVAAALVLALLIALPITALASRAGSWASIVSAAGDAAPELSRTLLLTLLGAACAAGVGAGLAAHGCWMRQRRQPSLVPLVLINLALPPTLLGIGCLELSRRDELAWLRLGDLLLLAGYIVRFAPLAALVLLILWSREGEQVAVATARRLGVPTLQLATRIVGPARLRDTALVAALLGLPLLAEVELSILLAPPGITTLGVRLYTMIHTSPDDAVSSLALVVLGTCVAAAFLGVLAWRLLPRTTAEAGT